MDNFFVSSYVQLMETIIPKYINKNDLISIASEANECSYSCINLPQYMSFINVYFISISNDLLDLSTESTNSTTQRKQL